MKVLLLLFLVVVADLPAGENIHEIGLANWSSFIDSDEVALVEFYSSLCGACRKFAPDYNKVGGFLKGAVKCGRISLEENRQKFDEIGVDTVPTVVLFRRNDKIEMWKASNTRTPSTIVDWVASLIPVLTIDDDHFEAFYNPPHEVYPNRILLFHDKAEAPRVVNRIQRNIVASHGVDAATWNREPKLPIFSIVRALNVSAEKTFHELNDPLFGQTVSQIDESQETRIQQTEQVLFSPILVVLLFVLLTLALVCCYFAHALSQTKPKRRRGPPRNEELTSVRWTEDGKHQD